MLDFSNVKTSTGNKFVGYGINPEVEIEKVEANVEKTPYITIYFKIPGSEQTTRVNEFMTEKSQQYAMEKFLHLNNAVRKEEELRSKKFDSVEQLAAGLNQLWSGRRLRLKLSGSEYMGVDRDGNPKIKVGLQLPRFRFAEAILPGAEHAPIPETESKLEFDKSNKSDFRKLKTEQAPQAEEQTTGDLPF